MLDNLFSLRPPAQRQRTFLTPKTFFLSNNADYLCHLFMYRGTLAGILALLVLLSAIYLAPHTIPKVSAAFFRHHLILPVLFTNATKICALIAAFALYCKIRLNLDMSKDRVPVMVHTQLLLQQSRRWWISTALIYISAGFVCIYAAHIFVILVVSHVHQQESLVFILFVMIVQVPAPALGATALAVGLLLLEKSIRYFPQMTQDLRELAKHLSESSSSNSPQ